MPVSPNRRQRVIEFATPKVADLVVVEVVDASKNVGSAGAADNTAYGTAHPNTDKFPNFKLAHIKNADDQQGQFQYWYYVKDRSEQDKYNWEFQAAGVGSMRYDSVVRTYVLPRYGSDTDGALGSSQTGGTDVFDENLPALNSNMPSTIHDPFGGGLGSSTTPDTGYVLFEKKQVRSGDTTLDSLYVVEQRIYVKKVPIRRVDMDPEFSVPLRSKETLYYTGETLQKTVRFHQNDSDSDGTADSDVMAALSGTPTVDVAAKKGKDQSDMWGTFRETYPTDGSSTTTADSYFGIFREVRQLSNNWYAVAEREVIKMQRDNSASGDTPAVDGLVNSYYTTQDFTWPAVLDTDNGGPVDSESWARKNNKGADTVVYPVFKRDEYRGPTKMFVELYWKDSAFGEPTSTTFSAANLQKLDPMLPRPIEFTTPIIKLQIKSTLHPDVFFTATSGTNHPIYEYTGTQRIFTATGNHTDWPPSIVIKDSQRPFRGGYLRERLTAYPPA